MDANRRSRIKMSSVILAIFIPLGVFVGVGDLQSCVSSIDTCYVTSFNRTTPPLTVYGTDVQTRKPVVTDIDHVTDVYFDVNYILSSVLHGPYSFLRQNVNDVCYLLLFVILLWLLWRQNRQTAKLQSDFTFLAHQLSTTSLTLHQFIPELQECRQNLSSMKRFTKRLETLYTIADGNAQELKTVSAELSAWKSTWERREKKQKRCGDSDKPVVTQHAQELFLKAPLFEHFLKWNDNVIAHVHSTLQSHKRQIDDLYANGSVVHDKASTCSNSQSRMANRKCGSEGRHGLDR